MPVGSMACFRFVQAGAGYLRVSGEDARDWLDRQTTNNVMRVSPEQCVRTVLTSPTGRILDVLTVLDEGEALGLITLPGYAARTLRYLGGRIFFMDKVSVADDSTQTKVLLCDGKDPSVLARAMGLASLPDVDRVVLAQVGDAAVRSVGIPGMFGPAVLLVIPVEAWREVERRLDAAGIVPIDEDEYEVLRVEAGIPAAGHELTEAYTPLEVGLGDLIAEGKCYPGQEVIARQITYDKVVRRLVKLRLEAPVATGADVYVDGKRVGAVTSAVVSPRQGPIALAVLRRPYFEAGTQVEVDVGGETVSALTEPLRQTEL